VGGDRARPRGRDGGALRVLLAGGGGREHALAWELGNPGIAALARREPIAVDALEDLAAFAERERIDLTVVGPEQPLALGLVDVDIGRRALARLGVTA
jgi:phosphoribosylamine--glycine ligase